MMPFGKPHSIILIALDIDEVKVKITGGLFQTKQLIIAWNPSIPMR